MDKLKTLPSLTFSKKPVAKRHKVSGTHAGGGQVATTPWLFPKERVGGGKAVTNLWRFPKRRARGRASSDDPLALHNGKGLEWAIGDKPLALLEWNG